jgi:hypothetical protein
MLTWRQAQELKRQLEAFGPLWNEAEATLRAVPAQIEREVEIAKGQIQGAAAEAVARVHLSGGLTPEDLTRDQQLAIAAAVHGAIETVFSVIDEVTRLGESLNERALLETALAPVLARLVEIPAAQQRQAICAFAGAFIGGLIELAAARVRASAAKTERERA